MTFIHAGASRLSGASAPAKFYPPPPPPPTFWRRLDWPVSAARGRRGLLALLLVLAAAALLLFSASPAAAQSTTDYDTDDDNLIDVNTLAQLNAMRWDLNGDGTASAGNQASYATAFPNPEAGMGCPATCAGYELTADLDFNTDVSTDTGGGIVIDSEDDYWNGGGLAAHRQRRQYA